MTAQPIANTLRKDIPWLNYLFRLKNGPESNDEKCLNDFYDSVLVDLGRDFYHAKNK